MSTAQLKAQKVQAAIVDLVDEDEKLAIEVVTGSFVGLILELMKSRGLDASGDIKIDSGGQRDITIHAKEKA